jgi:hypothetical protein
MLKATALSFNGHVVSLVGERCLTVLVKNHIVAHGVYAVRHDVSSTYTA